MEPSNGSIPSAAELEAYTLGKLESQRAAQVESFLAQHPNCVALLDAAADDAVVRHLRGAGDLNAETLKAHDAATPPCSYRGQDAASSQDTTAAGSGAAASEKPLEDPVSALVNHPRYQVLRKIGEGGMGAVFLAEHRLMHRPVALKMIRTACLNNPQAVERFRREVQAAARLSHPNIVTAHDAEEIGGIHFLVMEYVEGVPLSGWLAEHGPLPAAEACLYVLQAALGLQHGHERSMVHRDLKPHNLMRAPDGAVKILDFGLARFSSESGATAAEATLAGMLLGTVDYMAPEQALDSHTADIRSDIYSLGCTLYHLLTGQVPFPSGTVMQKLRAHAEQEPAPLRELRPDIPASLAAVLARMTAKDPARRYQTPAEVAEALAPFTGGAPLPKAVPSLSRRRWLIAAGLLAVAAMAAVIISVKTQRGEITIETNDPSIEVVTRKNGDIVRIRDKKSGHVWELDTKKLNLGRADEEDGLRIDLDGKKPLIMRRRDGRLMVAITGPAGEPDRRQTAQTSSLPRTFKNSLGMEFALVPKGKSWLGGGAGKPGDREVEVPHDFYLGVYEVTQEEWKKVTNLAPSYFSRTGEGTDEVKEIGDDDLKRFPVEMVSWNDAQLFLAELNKRDKQSGWVYRLPTAAEWEYACRGGPLANKFDSAYDYYLEKPANQLGPGQANFLHESSLKRTCKVGSYKQPNSLGLYDMHGNVWELCDDEGRQPNGRLTRASAGGGWNYPAENCRATRDPSIDDPASYRSFNMGLRVARVPAEMAKGQWVEPDKPRLSVPGTKAGEIVLDDNFKEPRTSLFRDSARSKKSAMELVDGYYVMHLKYGKPDYVAWHPAGNHGDFICQAIGRVTGQRDGAWGIYFDGTPSTNSLKIMVRGDGQVEIGPSQTAKNFDTPKLVPFPPPDGFRPGEFNTLAVARLGEELSVYLNGKPVAKPFVPQQPIGKCVCGLQGEQHGKADVRVEFQRYTVWELISPPPK